MSTEAVLGFLLKCFTATLLGGSTLTSIAYVGELSKDTPADQVEGLVSLAERHRAYRIIIDWNRTAKPETPMSPDVFQAYSLLMDSDLQVLMTTHQRYLDAALIQVKQKLPPSQSRKIEGYAVRITAAFDGVARVDRTNQSIFIPVDLLHDVWTSAMAFEEIESMKPENFSKGIFYIGARVIPQIRAQYKGQSYLTQGFTQALTGKYWDVSPEKWNDAMSNSYSATRGAVLHQALHELCHVIFDHKAYGDISLQQASTQEEEADSCAINLMSDPRKESYNPSSALTAIGFRSVDLEGRIVTSPTHPPVICRLKSMAKVYLKEDAQGFLSQLEQMMDSMIPANERGKFQGPLRDAIAVCQ